MKTWPRIAIHPRCKRRGIEIGKECGLLGLVIGAESKESIRISLRGMLTVLDGKLNATARSHAVFVSERKLAARSFQAMQEVEYRLLFRLGSMRTLSTRAQAQYRDSN